MPDRRGPAAAVPALWEARQLVTLRISAIYMIAPKAQLHG
jgi:hypothetical protein